MINADNLIFLSPISIRLPSELYDLIEADARLFGFKKNGKSNINGFLNELLPSIIEVQDSITSSNFLSATKDQASSVIATSISCMDTVFKPLLSGNNITISFRVNKAHEKDFKNIYENVLPIYNMDFSALLRTLLTFYTINRLAIRERFLHFKNYTEISNAIIENKQCLCFLKEKSLLLSCLVILVSPVSDRNVVLGIDPNTGHAYPIPLHLITNAVVQDEVDGSMKNNLKFLKKAFEKYLKAEKELLKNK